MRIRDITFSEQFWKEWDSVPETTQNQFNKTIQLIAVSGGLLPSVNAHKIKGHPEGWWIGYCSVGVHAYRFLFSVSSSGTLVIERIMSHSEMDLYLRK